MKQKIDLLIEESVHMDFKPDEELNERIVENMKPRRKNKMIFGLPKVAVIALIVVSLGTAGVSAAKIMLRSVKVEDNYVSTGNQSYVKDYPRTTEITEKDHVVQVEQKGYEEGGKDDKWLFKSTEVLDGIDTVTHYTYKDYETIIETAKIDNWFTASYESDGNLTYSLTEAKNRVTKKDYKEHQIGGTLICKNGKFILDENYSENRVDDFGFSIMLQNTSNSRDYKAASGQVFTLVDEIVEQENEEGKVEKVTNTCVVISYGKYCGSLTFVNMKDKDIQKVLDTVKIPK